VDKIQQLTPLLAAFGAFCLLSALAAPLILHLAGLSAQQIVALLMGTMKFALQLVRELRGGARDE